MIIKRNIKTIVGSLSVLFFACFLGANSYAATGEYNYGAKYTYDGDTLTVSPGSGNFIFADSTFDWMVNNKSDIKKIIISEGIKSISANAFKDYANLEELVLPKTMPGQIGDYAFSGSPKLKNISIPDGLMQIGEYAFSGTGITRVEVPIWTDWIADNAFNDNTELIMVKEQEGIIAAGTAGALKQVNFRPNGEGTPQGGNCYDKSYFGSVYDTTAWWKLDTEGTLTIYGTLLHDSYSNSRVPWGCYEEQIKRVVINDDKTGKLTNSNKLDNSQKLPNSKYAIYASRPIDEIMDDRIKILKDGFPLFGDSRHKYAFGLQNLEEIIVNRGVEKIGRTSLTNRGIEQPEIHYYISKYVKTIAEDQVAVNSANYAPRQIHLEISNEDYLANGYDYTEFADENGIKDSLDNGIHGKAIIHSNTDPYYVSVNDTSAPDTISYNGRTLYKYETYITGENGSVNVSLPNVEGVEYFVKEIEAPEGFQIDPDVYRVDMSGKTIDIQVANYPIENQKSEGDPKKADAEKNPNTAASAPLVYFVLFGALSASVALVVRRVSKLAR